MTFQGDPHRTLGVSPGASLNEIRSAYRRLAKQYHPDAAGERALPRFLAIQAAYERLVDAEGRLRVVGGGRGRAGAGSGAADPWRTDPARARASREAWRARRAGAATGSADREPAAPSGGKQSSGSRKGADGGHRRPRKATQGSTTYDEATEIPRDPEWDGGSWYGPNLGTYWTINPREYADPRKHGPEYQARARRAARYATGDLPGEADATAATDAAASTDADAGGAWSWHGAAAGAAAGPRATETDGGGFEWGARDWTYEPGDRARPRGRAAGQDRDEAAGPGSDAPFARLGPAALLGLARRRTPGSRILLALVAWPPIGWVLDTALTSPPACPAGEAGCQVPLLLPLLQIVAQPLLLVGLYAAPAFAAVGAWATLAALVVALPVTVIVTAVAAPGSPDRAAIIVAMVAATYLAALAAGALVAWRQRADRNPEPWAGRDRRAP